MARIEQSIEINVPARIAYDQLTRFEQYPRFMEDVVQVRQLDDTHLHWHTKAGNLDMEWDAEITEQVPERCIAWRHTSTPHYTGRLELDALAPDRTKITVSVDAEHGQQVLAQHGDAERAVAERAEYGLAHFKKFIESRHAGNARAGGEKQRPRAVPQQARREVQHEGQPQDNRNSRRPGHKNVPGFPT